MDEKEKTETQKDNYERMLLAIAVLFANDINMDIKTQDEYSKLTPAQKTFAQKKFEQNPSLQRQVNRNQRISEETIVKDIAKIEKKEDDASDILQIVTVGDDKVCERCAKWQDKAISLSGKDSRYPSLQNAIDDGFLHYGCRCSLQEIPDVPNAGKRSDWMQRFRESEGLNHSSDITLAFSGCVCEIKNI